MPYAPPLIGVDIDAARLQLSKTCGADLTFNGRDPAALQKFVRELPGGGVDAVIELRAASASVDLAIDITRNRGRIFLGSVGSDALRPDVYGPLWIKGIQLIGGYVNAKPHGLRQTTMEMAGRWPPRAEAGPAHFGRGSWSSEAETCAFLELLRYRRINVQQLVTHRLRPADAGSAFATLGAGDASMLGAIFDWQQI